MITKEEYRNIFLNTINILKDEDNDKIIKKYIIDVIPSISGPNDAKHWHCGINLTKIEIKAMNLFEAWLVFYDFLCKNHPFNLIDYDYDLLYDEINFFYEKNNIKDFIQKHINNLSNEKNYVKWYFKVIK